MTNVQFLTMTLGLMVLFTLVIFAFAGPSSDKALSRRMALVRGRHSGSGAAALEEQMRRAIASRTKKQESALVSLIPNPENLTKRLRMTGKTWTLTQYLGANILIFSAVSVLLMLRGWPLLLAVFLGLAAGLGLPHMRVGGLIKKRVNQFNVNFPDALELMVRGLRSGLPISETLTVVANEVPGPVGEEFRMVTERIKIGKSMEAAMQETAERLGTPEFQFFTITLQIQRETGGNLAETLSNLATVLRQRAQMKLKIKAMSSESKASAYIIGALPFIVFGLICYINFDYMSPFFTPDPTGLFGLSLMQVVGIGGMCWMATGVFIMAQMINFEI